MRVGVLDVLPESALEGLTAEDLRLLLNGVGDINVAALVSYTSFNDESGEPPERLARFKRWLWAIVDKMTHLERQDLVSHFKLLSIKKDTIKNKAKYFITNVIVMSLMRQIFLTN